MLEIIFGEMSLMLFVTVLLAILWLWALIDIVSSDLTGMNKLIWLLLVLFLPFIGFILYLLIGRKKKNRIGLKNIIVISVIVIGTSILLLGYSGYVKSKSLITVPETVKVDHVVLTGKIFTNKDTILMIGNKEVQIHKDTLFWGITAPAPKAVLADSKVEVCLGNTTGTIPANDLTAVPYDEGKYGVDTEYYHEGCNLSDQKIVNGQKQYVKQQHHYIVDKKGHTFY